MMVKPQIQTIQLFNEPFDQLAHFKKDVLSGLSQQNKTIPSKYFYDQNGSKLFNQITEHPDYYLTQCEIEIIDNNKEMLANLFSGIALNLIELGPGEGIKTLLLLQEFKKQQLDFTYLPIDISNDYLTLLAESLPLKIPGLKVCGINSDFFHGLNWLSGTSNKRNLVLFLGSSIGNFDSAATIKFLQSIWHVLNHDDYILIGFDLRKDIPTLLRAYDDSTGLTQKFNYNLLTRMNRELGANFDLQLFKHYCSYNPELSAMESYLISTISQTVNFKALDKAFYFDEYEGIHVEYSHKYTLRQIENFATEAKFKIVRNFLDSKHYFVDSLWQVSKLRNSLHRFQPRVMD